MPNREKVIKGLKQIVNDPFMRAKADYWVIICSDAIELLKEQEPRELTMDEWREWKNNPKRNPICELWEHDTSPMWILIPDDVHEPALLMGKLKLFTGRPTLERCMAVKWND